MEVSTAPPNNNEEAPTPEKDPFISCLPELIPQTDLKAAFRATRKGVFVREDWEAKLIEVYRDWSKVQTGKESSKNDAKCHRRLFGEEKPKLYYLLDGKDCLTGYLPKKTRKRSCSIQWKEKRHSKLSRGTLRPFRLSPPQRPITKST